MWHLRGERWLFSLQCATNDRRWVLQRVVELCPYKKKIQYQHDVISKREGGSAIHPLSLSGRIRHSLHSHLPVQHTAEDSIHYSHYINRYIQSGDVDTQLTLDM